MRPELEELCIEVTSLPDETSRKAFLRQYASLVNPETVQALAEAVRLGVRIDLPKSSNLAEAAVVIARELGDDETTGRALRAKANTMWFKGDCRSAVELFDDAARLFERAGNMNEVGRTLSTSIQSLALLGRYDRAMQSAKRAREIFAALGETWRMARLEINVANILHRQNRYAEALSAYQRAYNELLEHKDTEAIGVALHNMAVCLIALDDFHAAHELYERVREVCQQYGMPLLVAQAEYNIAFLYYLRGEYSRALDLLRATKDTCRNNDDKYHVGLCDLDASEIYLELNLIQEAGEMAEASLEQFRHLEMNYEMTRSQINLAITSSLRKDTKKALELFEGAKQMAEREQNEVLPRLIDLYSAIVLCEEGDLTGAQQLCEQALRVFESAGLPSKHVSCRLLLGRILLSSGDYVGAARECENALSVVSGLDAPILLYQSQFLRGQILEASGDLEGAFDRYQQARAAVETLRSSLQGDELKIGFMRNRYGVYSRLVQLCMDPDFRRGSPEEAFSYVEAAKSRTLQDLILAGPQPRRPDSDDNEADRGIRALRKELNWYYHLIQREQYSADRVSEERVQALKAQSLARERKLNRALLQAPVSGRVGAALQTSRPASVSDIRNALGREATLLEYFAIDGQIHVAVLSFDTLQILPIARVSQIAPCLQLLDFQLSKFRLDPAYVVRFEAALIRATQTHLYSLYESLIKPIEGLLSGESLVIVPYGQLHSLPFHALFDGKQYMIDKFNVCYEPSASILAYSHRWQNPDLKASLIIGVEDAGMPSIKQEIETVRKAMPDAKVLWGAEATEEALRVYGANSRIIHIASHGYFRPDSPMFSAIRLADSYITLHDLYRMNLPAELLTLSGCVTGLNVVDEGDELIGLTRGLLYAGAQSLILSLWEVDDRSTSEFMKLFYAELASRPIKAHAFRSAMLRTREQFAHPYHWAAFKLIGRALI